MTLPASPTLESAAMNTSMTLPAWLGDCVPVFRAATRRSSLPGSSRYTVIGALTLVVLAVCALMFTRLEIWQAICFGAGLLLAAFLSAVLLHYVSGAALQYTPANAALVPRMNRLIRRTAALLWCGAMLGWIMVGVVAPHGALIVLVAALAQTLLSLGRTGYSAAIVVYIVADIAVTVGGKPLRDFVEQPAVLVVALVLAVLLAWRALVMLFPRAGDMPIDRSGKRKALLATLGNSPGDLARMQAARTPKFFNARVLARDVAQRRAGPLLMHALGPAGHRFYVTLPVAGGAAGLALLRVGAPLLWPAAGGVDKIVFMVTILSTMGALLAMFAAVARYSIGMAYFAAEQALVRMAPGVARPAQLNRALAFEMVRSLLTDWMVITGLLLALLAWWQVSGATMLHIGVLMCCPLVALSWPLRDYAAAKGFNWLHWIGMVGLMCVLGVTALLAGDKAAVTLVPVLIAAGMIGVARWRAMLAAPPAFPARRLD